MALDQGSRALPLATMYVKLYAAIVVLLAAIWGLVAKNYVFIEAGFKTSIVLLAIALFEHMIYGRTVNAAPTAFTIAVALIAFYFMQANAYIGLITYTALSIALLTTTERVRRVIDVTSPSIALYFTATSFFLATRSPLSILDASTVIAASMLLIVKALGAAPRGSLRIYRVYSYLATISIAIANKAFSSITAKLSIRRVGAGVNKLLRVAIEALEALAQLGRAPDIVKQKTVEHMALLPRRFFKLEKSIEDLFSNVSIAIEKLQYSLEHSFTILLFLMGMLMLASIIFYVVFLHS